MKLVVQMVRSPVGEVRVVSDGAAIHAIDFEDHDHRMERLLRLGWGGPVALERTDADPGGFGAALKRYFDGDLSAILNLPLKAGGTDFQRSVWSGLMTIPAGQTDTYSGLAARIGRPRAVRAVGLANGANPIAIVVPCHRVIGKSGALTGYGGGMARKDWLLRHEGVTGARLL